MYSIALLDFDGYFWSAWHAAPDEPLSVARQATVRKVRQLGYDYDHVAVAVDRGPYKRLETDPQYKANRDKKDRAALDMRRRTVEAIQADGFCVLEEKGYEADDMIATAVAKLGAGADDYEIDIYSADKDLLQLVAYPGNAIVEVVSPKTGERFSAIGVEAKHGVPPSRMAELLALTGDKVDNIPGVKGVGAKTAAKILAEHTYGSLLAMADGDAKRLAKTFRPALAAALLTAIEAGVLQKSLKLVTLLYDAPVDVAAILAERVPQKITDDGWDEETGEMNDQTEIESVEAVEIPADEPTQPSQPEPTIPEPPPTPRAEPVRAMVVAREPQEWTKELEPRSINEAKRLAQNVTESRLFTSFGPPQAVFLVIMAGREFGLGALASLRGFHVVKGRPAMSAQLMMGLCIRHHDCEYFRVVESTSERCIVESKRAAWPSPSRWEYTIDDAKLAGLLGSDNWRKDPKSMIVNRCISKGARFWYPDVLHGVYTPEELQSDA